MNANGSFSAAKYLVGKTLRFRLSRSGAVDEMVPAPALRVKLDTKNRKRAELWAGLVMFEDVVSHDAKAQTVAALLPQFSESAVSVGARWTGERRTFGGLGVADRAFVLRKVGAEAEIALDFKFSADALSKAAGDDWEMEALTGRADFDAERGMLKRSSLTFKFKTRSEGLEWTTKKVEAELALVK